MKHKRLQTTYATGLLLYAILDNTVSLLNCHYIIAYRFVI